MEFKEKIDTIINKLENKNYGYTSNGDEIWEEIEPILNELKQHRFKLEEDESVKKYLEVERRISYIFNQWANRTLYPK